MAIILSDGEGPLSPYANGLIDRSYAAHDESIFGHLVAEKGYPIKDALEDLAPQVKRAYRTTELAKQWLPILGGGTLLSAVGVGVGVGVGFGLIPAIPAIATLLLWNQTIDEWKVRSTEYQLHKKIFPNIPSLMFALSQRGATVEELIGAYDGLVQAIGNRIMSNQEISAADVRSFLEGKILEYRSNGNVFEEMEDLSMVTGNDLGPSIAVMTAPSTAQTELQPIAAAPSMTGGTIAPSYGVFKTRNPVDVLVDALFSNRSIWGGQRTGKTALAAKASAQICIKEPGVKIFYINLFAADFDATNQMFRHAHRAIICDLAPVKPYNAASTIEEAAKVFDEFIETSGAILIIDEAASVGNINGRHFEGLTPLIDELVGYLSAIKGSTRKRRKAIWTIAPEIVAGDIGPGMKSLMKGFSPVLVAIPKGREVYWEGQRIEADTTLQGQLEVNFKPLRFAVPEMDVDRACFIDSVWMPLGDCTIPNVPTQSAQTATFQTEAIQQEPDDFEDLPDFFKAMAIVALNTQTASDRSIITNDLAHAQSAAKAMRAAADNGDNAKFEENKTILTDRIQRLKSCNTAGSPMQIMTIPKKPSYTTSFTHGKDFINAYSTSLHPKDHEIRESLRSAGYSIKWIQDSPYSKYEVHWDGLQVDRYELISEIQALYGV